MSGHSKWAQIKHQKGAVDAKRGKLFSKLSLAISIAARDGASPDANPRLRAAIDKAREYQVPNENIERAIRRVTESKESLESVVYEAYGPEGVALYIETVTDNRNRTLNEIKILLGEHDAKLGEPGSARWAFGFAEGEITPKYTQTVADTTKQSIVSLCEALEDRDDVARVATNVA